MHSLSKIGHYRTLRISRFEGMPEAALNPPRQERRKESRKRVVTRGKVLYSDGAFSVDCLIRNISAKAARITVQKGVGIPSCVYLIDIPAGLAYAAEVASIGGFSFGLRFLRSYKLAELNDPDLKYLKYAWLGCAR
jgi:hypothetical protein